ncbi:leucyl aminopeptidase family protein, partial [Methylobacterium sp. WL122]
MTDTAPSIPPLLPAGTPGIPVTLVAKAGWPATEAGLEASQRTYAAATGFTAKAGQLALL